LLKDFSSRSEFSDWFSRDDGPKKPTILKPNPRNVELDEKMVQLEENIKRYMPVRDPMSESHN
jgi:kinetochore protein Mis13/DSN1